MTERFFFCHLQKTGGLSVSRRLLHQFSAPEIYPDDSDGSGPKRTVSVEHLVERWPERRAQVRVVTGHFPLCTTGLLGGGFTTFTILRDPVSRVVSNLRHHRRMFPERAHLSLHELYDDEMRVALLLRNHMVKMLSLDVDEMTDGMYSNPDYTRQRLERAKARLAEVDVVGVMEDHAGFCAELEQTFGWDLGPELFVHRSPPEAGPAGRGEDPAEDPADDALIARIRADNGFDEQLYAFARDLVAARRKSSP